MLYNYIDAKMVDEALGDRQSIYFFYHFSDFRYRIHHFDLLKFI